MPINDCKQPTILSISTSDPPSAPQPVDQCRLRRLMSGVWLSWQLQLFAQSPIISPWQSVNCATGLTCKSCRLVFVAFPSTSWKRRASWRDQAPSPPLSRSCLKEQKDCGRVKTNSPTLWWLFCSKSTFCERRVGGHDVRCGFSRKDVSHLL